MVIKFRVRNLQDAMVISRAASATGQSVEELAKSALYREVVRIYDRINALKGLNDGNSTGVIEGNTTAISQAGNADSDSLANQKNATSEMGNATGT